MRKKIIILIFLIFSLISYGEWGVKYYPTVSFKHDSLERTKNSIVDGFGDIYHFDTGEKLKSSKTSKELLIYLRSDTKNYFEFNWGLGFPEGQGSYTIVGLGVGRCLDYNKFSIDIGINLENLSYSWKCDSYPSAWSGDPGYYNGDFTKPGTDVTLSSIGGGFKVYSQLECYNFLLLDLGYRINDDFDNVKVDELDIDRDLNFNASSFMLGIGVKF